MDKCPVYLAYKCPVCLLCRYFSFKLPSGNHHRCYYQTILTISIQAGFQIQWLFQSTDEKKKLSRFDEMWKEQNSAKKPNRNTSHSLLFLPFICISSHFLFSVSLNRWMNGVVYSWVSTNPCWKIIEMLSLFLEWTLFEIEHCFS